MDYKGYCLWADDVPDPDAPHYIVITSSENCDGLVMVVAISSIKYKTDGGEKYYDKACILKTGEIVDDKGVSVISRLCRSGFLSKEEISPDVKKAIYNFSI